MSDRLQVVRDDSTGMVGIVVSSHFEPALGWQTGADGMEVLSVQPIGTTDEVARVSLLADEVTPIGMLVKSPAGSQFIQLFDEYEVEEV